MSKKMKRRERVRQINAQSKGELVDNQPRKDYLDSLLDKPSYKQNDQGFGGSSSSGSISGINRKTRIRQTQYEGLISSATAINTAPMFVYFFFVFLFIAAVFILYMWLD